MHHPLAAGSRSTRYALLGLCFVSLAITFAVAADEFGLGGRPWFGWWDSNVTTVSPYRLAIAPRINGAAARAGLRDGDRIDLRQQTREARVAVLYQLMATQYTPLRVDRGGSSRHLYIRGSSVWENASFWKLQPFVTRAMLGIWFTVCALLIVLRKPLSRGGALFALVLVLIVGTAVDPSFLVVPSAALSMLLLMISRGGSAAAAIILIVISSTYGARSARRGALESLGYASVAVGYAADAAGAFGLWTNALNPIPFVLSLGAWRSGWQIVVGVVVLLTAAAAVAATASPQRRSVVWLILPLPAALLASAVCFAAPVLARSWFANVAVIAISNGALLLGAACVTYCLLEGQ